jgi:hypothetical protein
MFNSPWRIAGGDHSRPVSGNVRVNDTQRETLHITIVPAKCKSRKPPKMAAAMPAMLTRS